MSEVFCACRSFFVRVGCFCACPSVFVRVGGFLVRVGGQEPSGTVRNRQEPSGTFKNIQEPSRTVRNLQILIIWGGPEGIRNDPDTFRSQVSMPG